MRIPFMFLATAALLATANLAWADEDDHDFDPGPPIIGTPVTPVLPVLGTWARATASRAEFTGCAAYGLGDINVETTSPSGFAETVSCNDSVYDTNRSENSSTTPGEFVTARRGAGLSSDWRDAGAGAAAQANLLGSSNTLSLKAGSRSSNSGDAEFTVGITQDPQTGDPDGWAPGSSGFDTARVEGETDSWGASSLARLADTVVADGSGRLRIEFSVDGLFERGGAFQNIIDTGGRVSFAAVLLDPLGLEELNFGGDFGTVRRWREGAIASAGFALGRDARDSLVGRNPFPDGEQVLGSADLRDFAPRSSKAASADLPTSPTGVLEQLSLELDLVDGKTYWLIAGLFTSASGWGPCDQPGDGRRVQCAGGAGSGNGGTLVDFTSTARLGAVTLGEGLRGLTSASGVDYQLAVSPVPLPAGVWLLGTGMAVLGGRWWRARGSRTA